MWTRSTLIRISSRFHMKLGTMSRLINKIVDIRSKRVIRISHHLASANVYTYSKKSNRPRSYVTFKIWLGPISAEPLTIITSDTPIMVKPCITSERMAAFSPPCKYMKFMNFFTQNFEAIIFFSEFFMNSFQRIFEVV